MIPLYMSVHVVDGSRALYTMERSTFEYSCNTSYIASNAETSIWNAVYQTSHGGVEQALFEINVYRRRTSHGGIEQAL